MSIGSPIRRHLAASAATVAGVADNSRNTASISGGNEVKRTVNREVLPGTLATETVWPALAPLPPPAGIVLRRVTIIQTPP